MRKLRIACGIGLWLTAIGLAFATVRSGLAERGTSQSTVQRELVTLATASRTTRRIRSEQAMRFVVGDPVFAPDVTGRLQHIGEVSAVFPREGAGIARSAVTTTAEVVFYGRPPGDVMLTRYASPDSLAATVATMLPRHRQAEIAREIRGSVEANRQEIVRQLKPVVEKSLRESVRVVQRELSAALGRHRQDLADLGDKYQRDLVKSKVVHKRARPLAEDIGRVLWDRLSLWRFGWRYLSDKTPLTGTGRVKSEWQRFVNQEVVPELERRSDDIVTVVQKILADVAANPEVRTAARENLTAILEDPQVHRIVWQIFREVMIESPRVRQVLEDNWRSPEARNAFRLASARFEPTAVRIGELLFGSPEAGITPEFASVLRRQVLLKDQRWLVVTPRPNASAVRSGRSVIPVVSGGESSDHPGLPAGQGE